MAPLVAKINLFFACALPSNTFFFLNPWWKYLNGKVDALGNCSPSIDIANHPGDLWLIGLAVLDDLLRIAGFVAVVSIMVAGVQLIFTEGNPERATSARNRLINSLVGLAIAFSAVGMVALVSNTIGGSTSGGGLPNASASTSTIQHLLNIGFVIMGAFAFLIVVLAGFRYIISGDNPTKVSEARRQIIYAALGLLVIAIASSLVNFVINRLT